MESPSTTVRDPLAIRALAHPIRLALLEILGGEGQATATRCAELSGQSVASCSFHLRTLARHGFIEAAPATGKNKPWRLTNLRQRIVPPLDGSDEDTRAAGRAFDDFFLDHEFARVRAWLQRRGETAKAWQRATEMFGATAWLTVDELVEINEEMNALIERHFVARLREGNRGGGDRRPVRLFVASSVGLFNPEAD